MSYRRAPRRELKTNKHWNPDVLRDALRKHDRSLKQILKDISSLPSVPTGWQGLYNDTCRWRAMDPDLQRLIDENAAALNPDKKQPGGRKRKDEKLDDTMWRERYVEEYFATNSKDKAAARTPYKASEINAMLTPGRTEYDKLFAEMVEVVEQRQIDKTVEMVYNARDEAVKNGADPKTQAYIGLGILKTHSKGWQQKQQLDVNVNGTVKFQLDRQRVVGELIADQQRFFEKTRPLALTSGEVIDAEVVKSDS